MATPTNAVMGLAFLRNWRAKVALGLGKVLNAWTTMSTTRESDFIVKAVPVYVNTKLVPHASTTMNAIATHAAGGGLVEAVTNDCIGLLQFSA